MFFKRKPAVNTTEVAATGESAPLKPNAECTPTFPASISGDSVSAYGQLSAELLRKYLGVADLSRIQSCALQINVDNHSIHDLTAMLPQLTALSLNTSSISTFRDLSFHSTTLRVLSLDDCDLNEIDGLAEAAPSLTTLSLQGNMIDDIMPLAYHSTLSCLNLAYNKLSDPDIIDWLASIPQLRKLTLYPNPICAYENYHSYIVAKIPTLIELDGATIAGGVSSSTSMSTLSDDIGDRDEDKHKQVMSLIRSYRRGDRSMVTTHTTCDTIATATPPPIQAAITIASSAATAVASTSLISASIADTFTSASSASTPTAATPTTFTTSTSISATPSPTSTTATATATYSATNPSSSTATVASTAATVVSLISTPTAVSLASPNSPLSSSASSSTAASTSTSTSTFTTTTVTASATASSPLSAPPLPSSPSLSAPAQPCMLSPSSLKQASATRAATSAPAPTPASAPVPKLGFFASFAPQALIERQRQQQLQQQQQQQRGVSQSQSSLSPSPQASLPLHHVATPTSAETGGNTSTGMGMVTGMCVTARMRVASANGPSPNVGMGTGKGVGAEQDDDMTDADREKYDNEERNMNFPRNLPPRRAHSTKIPGKDSEEVIPDPEFTFIRNNIPRNPQPLRSGGTTPILRVRPRPPSTGTNASNTSAASSGSRMYIIKRPHHDDNADGGVRESAHTNGNGNDNVGRVVGAPVSQAPSTYMVDADPHSPTTQAHAPADTTSNGILQQVRVRPALHTPPSRSIAMQQHQHQQQQQHYQQTQQYPQQQRPVGVDVDVITGRRPPSTGSTVVPMPRMSSPASTANSISPASSVGTIGASGMTRMPSTGSVGSVTRDLSQGSGSVVAAGVGLNGVVRTSSQRALPPLIAAPEVLRKPSVNMAFCGTGTGTGFPVVAPTGEFASTGTLGNTGILSSTGTLSTHAHVHPQHTHMPIHVRASVQGHGQSHAQAPLRRIVVQTQQTAGPVRMTPRDNILGNASNFGIPQNSGLLSKPGVESHDNSASRPANGMPAYYGREMHTHTPVAANTGTSADVGASGSDTGAQRLMTSGSAGAGADMGMSTSQSDMKRYHELGHYGIGNLHPQTQNSGNPVRVRVNPPPRNPKSSGNAAQVPTSPTKSGKISINVRPRPPSDTTAPYTGAAVPSTAVVRSQPQSQPQSHSQVQSQRVQRPVRPQQPPPRAPHVPGTGTGTGTEVGPHAGTGMGMATPQSRLPGAGPVQVRVSVGGSRPAPPPGARATAAVSGSVPTAAAASAIKSAGVDVGVDVRGSGTGLSTPLLEVEEEVVSTDMGVFATNLPENTVDSRPPSAVLSQSSDGRAVVGNHGRKFVVHRRDKSIN